MNLFCTIRYDMEWDRARCVSVLYGLAIRDYEHTGRNRGNDQVHLVEVDRTGLSPKKLNE